MTTDTDRLVDHYRTARGVAVGDHTAARIVAELGSEHAAAVGTFAELRCRAVRTGQPAVIRTTSTEVRAALSG